MDLTTGALSQRPGALLPDSGSANDGESSTGDFRGMNEYERVMARYPVIKAFMGENQTKALIQMKKAKTKTHNENDPLKEVVEEHYHAMLSAVELVLPKMMESDVVTVQAHIDALKDQGRQLPKKNLMELCCR